MDPFHTRKEGGDGEGDEDVRRGPWTLEEDTLLIRYISCHGEGRWNLLAKAAGLKRTGKSCRLRWLNYLKPDIKRGNLTPQEQLLILELHSKWGNRWSKIAQHLPGRTDNEIKNYWRTRVQKQAKQLNMESNSQSFIDAIRCFYMPRLVERIEQDSPVPSAATAMDPINTSSPQFHTSFMSPASPPRNPADHSYASYGFNGCSTSSYDFMLSFETEKLTNPLELSREPQMYNDSLFSFGPDAETQQQYSEIEGNTVLSSGGNMNCYYVDVSNSTGVDNMASMSVLTNSNIAGHGWFDDGMSYDPWNLDRLW